MSAWRELSEHVYKNIGSGFVHRASAIEQEQGLYCMLAACKQAGGLDISLRVLLQGITISPAASQLSFC